jgi:hypothetical protein
MSKKYEEESLGNVSTKKDLEKLLKKYKVVEKSGFRHVTFPVVRRVFSTLIANEIVSVQPMSLPSGLLFHLDYSYGTNSTGSLKPEEK